MSDIRKDQVDQWLKKLERESWQLELLVSAFTIFLLIQAIGAFDAFYADLPIQYNLNSGILSIIYVFLRLLGLSLEALTICLVIHLLLRGFWIGTIGLRSVQSEVDFSRLNYSDFFTKKLKKRVVSLDELVFVLDEMCSVIFSFSFLVISVLLAFGTFLIFIGLLAIVLNSLIEITTGWLSSAVHFLFSITFLIILLTGVVYLFDYFTLGWIKKIKWKWFVKVYYPIYKFYGVITLSFVSRSIYYYLISKFSKKKIRLVLLGFFVLYIASSITAYDQYQYYSSQDESLFLNTNYYDDFRGDNASVRKVSIASRVISGDFLTLFLRYNPVDNSLIESHCPNYEPAKEEGLNFTVRFETRDQGVAIDDNVFIESDVEKLLGCQSSIYHITVNDSIYSDNKFYYFNHPDKNQKGLTTMLPSSGFMQGENILKVQKVKLDSAGNPYHEDYAFVPFWFSRN